jgi:hypothetical protein
MYVRGMFKKRPNFVNSAAAGAESELRLLSALAAGFDNKLPFVPFRYEHYSSSYIR